MVVSRVVIITWVSNKGIFATALVVFGTTEEVNEKSNQENQDQQQYREDKPKWNCQVF